MLVPFVTTVEEVRAVVDRIRAAGKSIGFVPTMGALHEGHASLIRAARAASDFTVVSAFVNPTQFGPNEDYLHYPRTLDADQKVCTDAGADLLFGPLVREMYPEDHRTIVEVLELGDDLCGKSRPGHFRGVCTIVLKLLNIVRPTRVHFGSKDYQQARIIVQMVRDLDLTVEVRVEPTIREADGFAMSSRNRLLTPEQRKVAPGIYAALQRIKARVAAGEIDVARLESALAAEISAIPGARVDYARIVDANSLRKLSRIDGPAVAAVAVFLGTTRVIDNIAL
jgi:pantoate--beta-alanine ligase